MKATGAKVNPVATLAELVAKGSVEEVKAAVQAAQQAAEVVGTRRRAKQAAATAAANARQTALEVERALQEQQVKREAIAAEAEAAAYNAREEAERVSLDAREAAEREVNEAYDRAEVCAMRAEPPRAQTLPAPVPACLSPTYGGR